MSVFRKYAYAWITLTFFLVSLALHWYFGWQAYVDEAREHGSMPEMNGYLVEMSRDTFENWQSEFLQLLWQVVGLPISSTLAHRARKRMMTGSRPRSTRCCGSAPVPRKPTS